MRSRWTRQHPGEAIFVLGSLLHLGSLLWLSRRVDPRTCSDSGAADAETGPVCDPCGGPGQRAVMEGMVGGEEWRIENQGSEGSLRSGR